MPEIVGYLAGAPVIVASARRRSRAGTVLPLERVVDTIDGAPVLLAAAERPLQKSVPTTSSQACVGE